MFTKNPKSSVCLGQHFLSKIRGDLNLPGNLVLVPCQLARLHSSVIKELKVYSKSLFSLCSNVYVPIIDLMPKANSETHGMMACGAIYIKGCQRIRKVDVYLFRTATQILSHESLIVVSALISTEVCMYSNNQHPKLGWSFNLITLTRIPLDSCNECLQWKPIQSMLLLPTYKEMCQKRNILG